MKFLADTDVVIYHLRGKKEIPQSVFKQGLAISVITQGELLYGAYKSQQKEKTLNIIKNFLFDLMVPILPLNDASLHEYARLKCELELEGRPLDDFDLLIGSTAITQSLILLTNNLKHFNRIPKLKINEI